MNYPVLFCNTVHLRTVHIFLNLLLFLFYNEYMRCSYSLTVAFLRTALLKGCFLYGYSKFQTRAGL